MIALWTSLSFVQLPGVGWFLCAYNLLSYLDWHLLPHWYSWHPTHLLPHYVLMVILLAINVPQWQQTACTTAPRTVPKQKHAQQTESVWPQTVRRLRTGRNRGRNHNVHSTENHGSDDPDFVDDLKTWPSIWSTSYRVTAWAKVATVVMRYSSPQDQGNRTPWRAHPESQSIHRSPREHSSAENLPVDVSCTTGYRQDTANRSHSRQQHQTDSIQWLGHQTLWQNKLAM